VTYFLLTACGALFGLSYVLVRDTVGALGPIGVTVGRALIGGLVLLLVAVLRRTPVRLRPRYLVLGLLSAAVPFSLISLSMLSLNAGTAAVLNASSPMFALAIDSVGRRSWPRLAQLFGLVLASVGVVIVMAVRGLGGSPLGIVAGLAGAAVFAYAGFYAARHFAATPPLALAAGQQLAACALLFPLTLVFTPAGPVRPGVVGRLVLLGLLCSALAYLLFYRLIATVGPALTANVNLLVPMFGVLWGRLLLAEPIALVSVAGMGLTVAGLALVLHRPGTGNGAASSWNA
jgi:drug/metabolite transporter (DMT)-like permease